MDRRNFIKTAALCGGTVTLVGIPLASYFIAPALKKGTGKWVDFGAAQDLNPGSIEMLSYEFMVKDGWQVLPQRGFVWAKTEKAGKILIFSSTCTHLACNVIWREEEEVFECPCHSGRFDINGRPIAGPPTKPLSVLTHKIEDDKLMVYLSF
ncbi:MAG: ubiquinol-cytochrome c reductase iron-sulfur subunit [Desulfobacterales bacterium]